MAKILLFPIFAIVSLVILVNALSVAIQATNPALSVWLNPLNMDARITLVSKNSIGKDTSNSNEQKDLIHIGRKYAPIDARLISLDGIYNKRNGDFIKAQEHFSTALGILPTQYQALLHKFEHQFNNMQYVEALDIINIISKRWPDRQNTFQQFIPAIVITQTGYNHASKLFDTSKQFRHLIISALVRNPATINLAVNLVQNWNDGTNKSYWELGNFITHKLIRDRKYKESNIAFRSFLNEKEKNEYKYVYNPNFEKPIIHNLFDWWIRHQVGVSHTIKQKKQNGTNQSYLEIRFLGKPIQYKNATQLVRLPAGDYSLKTHYFSKGLKAPKPIKIGVSCYKPNKVLASYTFETTSPKTIRGEIAFKVPSKDCDLAQLYFHTDFLAKSWRNRYSGILEIYNVSIERAVN